MVWTKEGLMPAAETPPAVDSQLSALNPGAIMAFTFEKLLLRKRPTIETINDQLKKISQIEHARHRSG